MQRWDWLCLSRHPGQKLLTHDPAPSASASPFDVQSVLAKATEALITALDGEPEGADTEAGVASGVAGAGSGVVGAGLGDAAGGVQPHQPPPASTAPEGN